LTFNGRPGVDHALQSEGPIRWAGPLQRLVSRLPPHAVTLEEGAYRLRFDVNGHSDVRTSPVPLLKGEDPKVIRGEHAESRDLLKPELLVRAPVRAKNPIVEHHDC
jgi:hypothetical protein